MAQVTITLTDRTDGCLDVSLDFDPPVEAEQAATASQVVAFKILDYISSLNESA